MAGIPTYDKDTLFPQILEQIADGKSLREISRQEGMPAPSTVLKWVNGDETGKMGEQYARAMHVRADVIFDEVLEIADDGANDYMKTDGGIEKLNGEHVQRSRLRIDARKWALGRMNPKKYGDKLGLEHTGEGGGPIQITIGNGDDAL